MGHGYVIGADNWNSLPSAILDWEFARNPLSGRMVFHSPNWTAPAANHISHTNARPDLPLAQQYACGSAATRASGVWGNEIVCFRLDNSFDVLVVAPVLTNLDAAGGGDDYAKMPKGNLDVTGRYFLWTSNAGGSRLDAFLVKVPAQLLVTAPDDPASDDPPPPDPPPADEPPAGGTGPIGVWTLDEGTGTSAGDSSGNGRAGTLVNGPAWTAGVLGAALSFDGADDYVAVPHQTALNPYPLSLSFWMRTSATGLHGVVNKYVASAFNGYQVYVNGGSLCAWYMRDAGNAVWDGGSCTLATSGVTDGAWHHVVFVVDAAGGRLYVDGVSRAARAWTGTPGAATTTTALSFGRYPGVAAPYLPGALDDVRLYARALSSVEVTALRDAVDRTAPVISSVTATGVTSTGATIGWSTGEPADTQIEYGTTTALGTLTPVDPALATAHAVTISGLVSATQYHYRVRSRDAAGNLAVSGTFTFTTAAATAPPPSGSKRSRPVGHWKLNEAAGLSGADSSGNGFTGLLANGPLWAAGALGAALSFDGIDDYVEIAHAAALNAYPMTLVFWVRTTATGLHGVVNKYVASAFDGYQVYVNGGSLCAWYMRDRTNAVWDGTSCTLRTAGVTDGAWHHVALAVDDAGGRLYVDGDLRASQAWTGAPGAATTAASLSFARYPGVAAPHLPGALDDVRLYSRALNADEIFGLYSGAAL
jgi:hypothetical protein